MLRECFEAYTRGKFAGKNIKFETRTIISFLCKQKLDACHLEVLTEKRRERERVMKMKIMMNFFHGMVDQWKVFSLISRRDHCQRSSSSRTFDTLQRGFEPWTSAESEFSICWMKLRKNDNSFWDSLKGKFP